MDPLLHQMQGPFNTGAKLNLFRHKIQWKSIQTPSISDLLTRSMVFLKFYFYFLSLKIMCIIITSETEQSYTQKKLVISHLLIPSFLSSSFSLHMYIHMCDHVMLAKWVISYICVHIHVLKHINI